MKAECSIGLVNAIEPTNVARMRSPSDFRMPPVNKPSKRQILIFVIIGIILVLLASLRGVARLYTDFLWFKEVKFSSVWTGIIGTKVMLVGAFFLVALVVFLLNFFIARRISPESTLLRPDEELIRAFRLLMRKSGGRLIAGVSVLFALFVAWPASSQWQSWMMFSNGGKFGQADQQFKRDVGFYVFKLPFISYFTDWLFMLLLWTVIVLAGFYFLMGGIQFQTAVDRVRKGVRAHLSALLGLLAILKAVDYFLQRFELNFSTRGVTSGAGYTDVHAVLPALKFLMLVAIFAAVLFLANIVVKKWTLPVIAVLMWTVLELVLAGAYPAVIQKYSVKPNEKDKEAPYIQRNIDATLKALDISTIESRPFNYGAPWTGTITGTGAAQVVACVGIPPLSLFHKKPLTIVSVCV